MSTKYLLLLAAMPLALSACSSAGLEAGGKATLSAAGGFACSVATGGLCAIALVGYEIGSAAHRAEQAAKLKRVKAAIAYARAVDNREMRRATMSLITWNGE